jgi:prepilin-type N-terminal cleavage/methylation domain-containing protein
MRRSRAGLTLIEILVTMALLSLVMGLIVNFFVTQSRAARLQKAMNETSEATRVALSLITWDLQNAGYRVNVSYPTDPNIPANPAIKTSYPLPSGATAINNSSGLYDAVTIRFRDDPSNTPKRVSYGLASGALVRQVYNDDNNTIPIMEPTVQGIVALNIRYETRDNQFVLPSGNGTSKSCGTNQTAFPEGATGSAITNCVVNWQFKDEPGRLVRQVKVQVLARSSEKISGHTNSVSSYSFDNPPTSTPYTTSAGYVYQFSEQIIVASNLGR